MIPDRSPRPPDPSLLPSSENRRAISGAACCLVVGLGLHGGQYLHAAIDRLAVRSVLGRLRPRDWSPRSLVAPWLLYQAIRGRPTLPSGRTLAQILLVGLLIQVVGNVCVQWALGVVGLAVTIPADLRHHDRRRGGAGPRLAGRTGLAPLGGGHRAAVGGAGAAGNGRRSGRAVDCRRCDAGRARGCWSWPWPPPVWPGRLRR